MAGTYHGYHFIIMDTSTDLHVSKATGSVNNKQFLDEVSVWGRRQKVHIS